MRESDDDVPNWYRREQHYLNLADNANNTDRVDRENYWQHAEHFHRMIAEAANSHRRAGVGAAEPLPALCVD